MLLQILRQLEACCAALVVALVGPMELVSLHMPLQGILGLESFVAAHDVAEELAIIVCFNHINDR